MPAYQIKKATWRKPVRLLALSLLFASAAVAALPCCGDAAELRQIGTISIPGEALDSFDISFVDPKTNRYFLADRSNKAIDIFDARENRFIGRAEGFVGAVMKDGRVDNAHSGPNGVVTANGGTEIWAGDGDSTVKVINAKTMKVVDSISTGGKGRADEVGFDPKDQVFIVGNPSDEPPFLTLISTKPGHKIIGKIVVERASDGIEQPQYYAGDGMFYVDVPELDKDKTKGALAVVAGRTNRRSITRSANTIPRLPAIRAAAFWPSSTPRPTCWRRRSRLPAPRIRSRRAKRIIRYSCRWPRLEARAAAASWCSVRNSVHVRNVSGPSFWG
jgi:hypothetical protein